MSTPSAVVEKIKVCLGKHPDWSDARVAQACTTQVGPVRQVRGNVPVPCKQHPGYRAFRPPQTDCLGCGKMWEAKTKYGKANARFSFPPKPAAPAQTGGQKVGLTKAEFMAQHDPTTRTRNMMAAAVKLIKPNHFIKDYELRKLSSCGDTGLWNAVASDPDEGFRKYRFGLDGSIYWTDPKSRDEMLATNPKAKEI